MMTPEGPDLAAQQHEDNHRFEVMHPDSAIDGATAVLAVVHQFEVKIENKRHNLTVITAETVLKAVKQALLGAE